MKFSRSLLKFKIPAIFLSLVLTISITGFIYIYLSYSSNLRRNVENKMKLFSDSFKEQLKVQEQDLKMSMDLLLENKEIVKLFAEKKRDALRDKLLFFYNNKLKTKYNISQFQFHLSPAISFLRLHKVQKFGDDLSSFRKTVVEANKNNKIVSGIEVGRGGPGLRIVYPVNYGGHHIGSVEFGTSLDNIFKEIANTLNLSYAMGIKGSVFKKAKRFNNSNTDIKKGDIIYYDFSNNTSRDLIKSNLFSNKIKSLKENNRDYSLTAIPLYDYSNKQVGNIALFYDQTDDIAGFHSSLITALIYDLLFSLLIITIVFFYFKKVLFIPLELVTQYAENIGSKNFDINIEYDRDDELKVLVNALKTSALNVKQHLYLLNSLPTPVIKIDSNYNIQFANEAAAIFLEKDVKKLITEKCYDNFKTDHCQTENCALYKAMKNDRIESAETVSHACDRNLPIMYTGTPTKNEEEEIVGALEYVVDISRIKEIQDYLARSTKILLSAMEKFADGDLTVSVNPDKEEDDDIGRLFLGFNNAVKKIKAIITNVYEATLATASASTEISATAEEMAAGAQEQNAQTEEIATSVEEMNKTIIDSTKNTALVADSSNQVLQLASDGGEKVVETVEKMDNIATVVAEAAHNVQKLGQSSEQIGEILSVINEIADQTNLLALNAAIEAARAGEHGRGFAVVADEVRKLAERTSKATQEIADMISNIQEEMYNAVRTINNGTKEAEEGKELANQAGKAIAEITSSIDNTVEMINQVAAASEEQSSTFSQISTNIETISKVTTEATMGVEQMAKASEDLNQLTETLQNLISHFHLDDEKRANDVNFENVIEQWDLEKQSVI
ncbi:methyl-accepting chemotaxis protein CtpH [bacterium BMS3Abin04]|nr:methyl-accepting chemotaxis protein CtpH [bacterium BMS3Abin04]